MSEQPPSRVETWRQRLRNLRPRIRAALPFVWGMVAAFAAILIYNLLNPAPVPLTTRDVSTVIASAMASATPPSAYSARVYQAIMPSFVYIQTRAEDKDGKSSNGAGSGVIVNLRGDILTSLHVVEDASEIFLVFADGTEAAAQIRVKQPENDIAVLQPSALPAIWAPATLGNPNAMRIGDEAYVVGNPLGLYASMSTGVISGFDRSFRPPNREQRLEGLIQIDAAVNPGNSGGPLLNRYGQVVGIVTGLVNPIDQSFFVGIGFAVPITTAGGAAGAPPY